MDNKEELKKLEERKLFLEKTIRDMGGEKSDDESDGLEDVDSSHYENKFTDEILERFVDGILIILGELEASGQIPEIDNPRQAQQALLGIIRRLYTKKSAVGKMARKFVRFGAKRFLRRQKTAIQKALT